MDEHACIPWWLPLPHEHELADYVEWGVWRKDVYSDGNGGEA